MTHASQSPYAMQLQAKQLGNYHVCTHTPLELAQEKAASLRRSLEQVDAWRKELATLERMIAAAEEPGQ